MASVFTRIVHGEIPAWRVAESENCMAFLDVNPLVKGHTLVIPKKEVDYLFDLPEAEYLELMLFARKVAAGVRKAIPCLRIGVAVIGLEVPHAHIHLVPLNSMGDINFSKSKLTLPGEEMEKIAAEIRKNLPG
jgi:histidine triad (HIT) family protein